MLETTTNAKIREGFQRAHEHRGEALRAAIRWLRKRR